MTENIAGACVCSIRIAYNFRHNVQFYHFRNFICVKWNLMQTGYPVRAHKKVQTFESASADYFIGF